jgi:two-component sensor histidine kinase
MIILIIGGYRRAVHRLRHEDARHLTLAREQHHRVRNAAALVEGIVQLSLRDDPARAKAIIRRVRAGLTEIGVRDRSSGKPVNLREVLAAELQPYDLTRFSLEGEPDRTLSAEARDVVCLALHELTTNALKYGALSAPEGRVTVAWRTVDDRVVINWREAGGPPVKPPKRRGYGSIMLSRVMESAKGALSIDFQPTGVTAEISLPA